jgi:hypothetical protein
LRLGAYRSNSGRRNGSNTSCWCGGGGSSSSASREHSTGAAARNRGGGSTARVGVRRVLRANVDKTGATARTSGNGCWKRRGRQAEQLIQLNSRRQRLQARQRTLRCEHGINEGEGGLPLGAAARACSVRCSAGAARAGRTARCRCESTSDQTASSAASKRALARRAKCTRLSIATNYEGIDAQRRE